MWGFACKIAKNCRSCLSIFSGFFSFFYIVKILTYEQPFIWTIIHMFSYNTTVFYTATIYCSCMQSNYTEILHLIRSYTSYYLDPIPYSHGTTPKINIFLRYVSFTIAVCKSVQRLLQGLVFPLCKSFFIPYNSI